VRFALTVRWCLVLQDRIITKIPLPVCVQTGVPNVMYQNGELDFSLPRPFAPGSLELSLPGTFAPWNFSSLELLLPATFQANGGWSESKQPGAKVPAIEL